MECAICLGHGCKHLQWARSSLPLWDPLLTHLGRSLLSQRELVSEPTCEQPRPVCVCCATRLTLHVGRVVDVTCEVARGHFARTDCAHYVVSRFCKTQGTKVPRSRRAASVFLGAAFAWEALGNPRSWA